MNLNRRLDKKGRSPYGYLLGQVVTNITVFDYDFDKYYFSLFRDSDAVIVSPSCSLLKLRSSVLEMGLLDSSLSLLADRPVPLQGVQATCRASQQAVGGGVTPTTPLPPQGDQQVLAVATEKGVTVFALPSQRLTASSPLPEGVIVVR